MVKDPWLRFPGGEFKLKLGGRDRKRLGGGLLGCEGKGGVMRSSGRSAFVMLVVSGEPPKGKNGFFARIQSAVGLAGEAGSMALLFARV